MEPLYAINSPNTPAGAILIARGVPQSLHLPRTLSSGHVRRVSAEGNFGPLTEDFLGFLAPQDGKSNSMTPLPLQRPSVTETRELNSLRARLAGWSSRSTATGRLERLFRVWLEALSWRR